MSWRTFSGHKSGGNVDITAVVITEDASVVLSGQHRPSPTWLCMGPVEMVRRCSGQQRLGLRLVRGEGYAPRPLQRPSPRPPDDGICRRQSVLSHSHSHSPRLEAVGELRVLLLLKDCPHLPVLCLHNTPAGSVVAGGEGPGGTGSDARRRSSAVSQLSLASFPSPPPLSPLPASSGRAEGTGSEKSEGGTGPMAAAKPSGGGGVAARNRLKEPSSTGVFDRLERNRSRASVYLDDRSPRPARSSICPPPLFPPFPLSQRRDGKVGDLQRTRGVPREAKLWKWRLPSRVSAHCFDFKSAFLI